MVISFLPGCGNQLVAIEDKEEEEEEGGSKP